jgi:hypothetical protein
MYRFLPIFASIASFPRSFRRKHPVIVGVDLDLPAIWNAKMAGEKKLKVDPPAEKTISEKTISTVEVETGEQEAAHPRTGMPAWKWPATLAILVLMTLINGGL